MSITRAVGILASFAALAGAAPPAGAAATSLCAGRPSVFGPASRPFSPSTQLGSIDAARARVGFAPRLVPGRPFRVYVSREAERRHRRVGITYRRSASSWFTVTQERATTSRALFDSLIRDMSLRYECGGDATTLRLRDGSLALLVNARDRRVLRFRSNGIDLMLLASPTSASRERLVALANALT